MTEFAEGDLVEAVKGKRRVIDVVVKGNSPIFGDDIYLGEPSVISPSSIGQYEQKGFTLTVIEKVLPPLPTEPGVYLPYTYSDGRTPNVWLRKQGGQWLELPNAEGYEVTSLSEADLRRHGSTLTRLAPVAEVLGKIREQGIAITESRDAPYLTIDLDRFDAIAAEYGATK